MATNTAAAPNLFGTAKTKKVAAKDTGGSKVIVTEEECPGFSAALTNTKQCKEQEKLIKAKKAMNESIVKEAGKSKFFDLYDRKKVRPETFQLCDEKGQSITFMVKDDYTSLPKDDDDVRLNELIAKYGEDVVAIKKTFVLNPEILERHFDAITGAISEAVAGLDIPQEDKDELIQVEQKQEVSKGAIDKLFYFAPDNAEQRKKFLFDIQPIVALR